MTRRPHWPVRFYIACKCNPAGVVGEGLCWALSFALLACMFKAPQLWELMRG